jgi:hypothetical protein
METNTSLVTRLLFKNIHVPPKGSGRIVRFGDGDIDIEVATGTLPERVLTLLSKSREAMTAPEIARGIGSNPSRVSSTLKQLIRDGEIEQISVEGCLREYVLSK